MNNYYQRFQKQRENYLKTYDTPAKENLRSKSFDFFKRSFIIYFLKDGYRENFEIRYENEFRFNNRKLSEMNRYDMRELDKQLTENAREYLDLYYSISTIDNSTAYIREDDKIIDIALKEDTRILNNMRAVLIRNKKCFILMLRNNGFEVDDEVEVSLDCYTNGQVEDLV